MRRTLLSAVATAIGLVACAAEPPNEPLPDGLRVMVRLAPDRASGGAPDERPASIEHRAALSTGIAVKHVAASGGLWHALILRCRPDECASAVKRLAADNTWFSEVQTDEVRRR